MASVLKRLVRTRRMQMVDRGRVNCPIRGTDVDIDWCLGCDNLRAVVDDGRGSLKGIVCRPPFDAVPLAGGPYRYPSGI